MICEAQKQLRVHVITVCALHQVAVSAFQVLRQREVTGDVVYADHIEDVWLQLVLTACLLTTMDGVEEEGHPAVATLVAAVCHMLNMRAKRPRANGLQR